MGEPCEVNTFLHYAAKKREMVMKFPKPRVAVAVVPL